MSNLIIINYTDIITQMFAKFTAVSILAASVALLNSVAEAKFEWAPCPVVTSIPYAATMASNRYHKMMYFDTHSKNIYDKFTNLLKLSDISCLDVGQFPYPTAAIYSDYYVAETSPFYTKVLYFDATSGTELQYSCMDGARAISLVDTMIVGSGWTLAGIGKFFINTFIKLIGTFNFRGAIVFTNSNTALSNQVISDIGIALINKGTSLALSDLTLIDRSTCPA